MIKAAIFDVDGTLVDSNSAHVEAWREAFRHHGKALGVEEVHAQIGKGGDQLMPVFLTRDELDHFGDALDRLRGEIYRRDYLPNVPPFPKVRELFRRLKRDGLRIALASSAKEEEVEASEKKLGIEGLVDVATSAADVEHSKPCPDILEIALARLEGIAPNEAIVIGDSPYDAQAATRAGMQAIGLLSGGFTEDTLRQNGAIAVYRDIADVLERYAETPFGLKA